MRIKKDSIVEWGIALLFFTVPILLYSNILSANRIMVPGEGMISFTNKVFLYKNLISGQIPLWDSYAITGTPFLANSQSTFFYPLNALALFFPPTLFTNLYYIIHIGFAGYFTYLFLKQTSNNRLIAFAGGLVLMISGMIGGYRKDHVLVYTTIIWLPLILYFIDLFVSTGQRKYLVFSALVMTVQLVGGSPQHVFYTDVLAFAYLLYGQVLRKRKFFEIITDLFIWGGLYLLLSAAIIIPTAELVVQSARDDTSSYFCLYSTNGKVLLMMIFPFVFGSNILDPLGVFASSGVDYELYWGIIPLIYALYAVRYYFSNRVVKFGIVAIALAFIYSSGCNIPYLANVLKALPVMNFFGVQSRIIFIFVFFGICLFAYGIGDIGRPEHHGRLMSHSLLLMILISLLTGIITLSQSPVTSALGHIYSRQYWIPVLISIINFGMIFILYRFFRYKPLQFVITYLVVLLLVLITFYDVGRFSLFIAATPENNFEVLTQTEETTVLKSLLRDGPYRVLPIYNQVYGGSYYRSGLVDNWSRINSIRNIKGWTEFDNPRLNELLGQVESRDNTNGYNLLNEGSILSMLSVKYILIPHDSPVPDTTAAILGADNSNYALVSQTSRYRIYENKRAKELLYIPEKVKSLNSAKNLRRNPGKYAAMDRISYVEGFKSFSTGGELEILSVNNNSLSARVSSESPTFVVHSQSYYPGWKAFVDGTPAHIYLVNGVVQGIEVPAGEHLVKFEYDPWSAKIGVAISLMALLFAAAYLLWDKKKSNPPP